MVVNSDKHERILDDETIKRHDDSYTAKIESTNAIYNAFKKAHYFGANVLRVSFLFLFIKNFGEIGYEHVSETRNAYNLSQVATENHLKWLVLLSFEKIVSLFCQALYYISVLSVCLGRNILLL